MSDEENISVDMPAPTKKKVKSKKIAKAAPKKKVAKKAAPKKEPKPKKAKKEPKAKTRTRIDTSGPRKEVKIAESLYDILQTFANKNELASVGHAADKFISVGITRKKALDKYAKTQKE